MARCVVDASVVAKWFLEEEFSDDARRLRDDYSSDLIEVEAPATLPFEVLNAFRDAGVFSVDELRRARTSAFRAGARHTLRVMPEVDRYSCGWRNRLTMPGSMRLIGAFPEDSIVASSS